MSKPSPIYLLVTAPSWGSTDRWTDVLEGLESWDYDPNETHDDVSLLQGLLRNPQGSINGSRLLAVVEVLLRKGADPANARLSQKLTGHFGSGIPARLQAATHIAVEAIADKTMSLEEALLAARFVQVAGLGFIKKNEISDALDALVPGKVTGRWAQQTFEGVRVLPWLAMRAGALDGGLGLGLNANSGSDVIEYQLITLATLVDASDEKTRTDKAQVLMTCAGLMATVIHTRPTTEAVKKAVKRLGNTLNDLFKSLDDVVVSDIVDEILEDPRYPSSTKRLIGLNFMQGLAPVVEEKHLWNVVTDGLRLIEDGPITSNMFSSALKHGHHPTSEFWDNLAHNAKGRLVATNILEAALAEGDKVKHVALIDDITQWIVRNKGTALPMDQIIWSKSSKPDVNDTILAAMERHTLETNTAASVQPQAGKVRGVRL